MRRTPAIALGAVALSCLPLALGACATPVQSTSYSALEEQAVPQRIAVAPFRLSDVLARDAAGSPAAALAAELLTRQVADRLAADGREVVPSEEVAEAMRTAFASPLDATREQVARLVAERFGADAVLFGTLGRFRERSGGAAGTLEPASVRFEVLLAAAPGGERLWSARFDQTQPALTENLFLALRYPGSGTRWLTAEELSGWGAQEVASALP